MVRDRIASEPPERLDMRDFHTDCGTAHCIAGWAHIVARGKRTREDSEVVSTFFLGLNKDQAFDLYFPDVNIPWRDITQSDALAALDSLINAESDDALPVWPEPRT